MYSMKKFVRLCVSIDQTLPLPDKLEVVEEILRRSALPLPMGEVPPKGAERALSVTANAVPALP